MNERKENENKGYAILQNLAIKTRELLWRKTRAYLISLLLLRRSTIVFVGWGDGVHKVGDKKAHPTCWRLPMDEQGEQNAERTSSIQGKEGVSWANGGGKGRQEDTYLVKEWEVERIHSWQLSFLQSGHSRHPTGARVAPEDRSVVLTV